LSDTIYLWIGAQLVGILTASVVTVVAWKRRHKRGALPLCAMTAGAVFWSLTELLTGYMPSYETAVYSGNLTLAGVNLCTTAFFVFTLEYTGREEFITRKTLTLLSIEPLFVQCAVWTNEWHRLFFEEIPRRPETFRTIDYVFGPAFWVHAIYSYLLIAASIVLLLLMLYRRETTYRVQSVAVAITTFVPLVANFISVADILAVNLSLSPPAFAISGTALGIAILRADLTNVTPLAHSTVLANISDGVVVLDEENRVLELNPMARRILAIDRSPVGEHASELLSEYPDIWAHFADRQEGHEEVDVKTPEGRRSFHVRISPLEDGRGRRVGRLFVFHDITRQKRRERELEQQNEQLDQFASLVSHDLRNPLSISDGYVELAKEADDMEAVDAHLEKIDGANQRMRELIDDVLTLARQGRTVEDTIDVELELVAHAAWQNVDTHDGELVVERNCTFRADEDRLLRVFENLFRNSIDHGDETVTITVGVMTGTGDLPLGATRSQARGLYVADDGPGIPEEHRDSIFEDGFTTAQDGTGLGLSIVSTIVEAHGWEIQATESETGGARFELHGMEATAVDSGPAGPHETT
jgi:PAS domain S-box-containing protein